MPTPESVVERITMFLQDFAVLQYARLPIPSDYDVLLRELVEALTSATAKERERQATALDRLMKGALLHFALRSASAAVRETNQARLHEGLAALVIAGHKDDPRDLDVIACALYDASRRLGLIPSETFAAATSLIGGGGSKILAAFAEMPEEKVTLERYRVLERKDADGFRYSYKAYGQPV